MSKNIIIFMFICIITSDVTIIVLIVQTFLIIFPYNVVIEIPNFVRTNYNIQLLDN